MSAHHIFQTEDTVHLASDTLNLDVGQGGAPAMFAEKATMIPHMNLIIAGSGFSAFTAEWRWMLAFQCLETDIVDINEVAPEMLREAWSRFKLKHNPPTGEKAGDSGTAIYHAGYSPKEDQCISWRYFSENDFEPELLGAGRLEYVQPKTQDIQETLQREDTHLKERIRRVFQTVKELDEANPPEERLGVGGEIWLRSLSKNQASVQRIHVFDDYEETRQALVGNSQSQTWST